MEIKREKAESQVYSQGVNHHSSNGDQLGSAGKRRQSLRHTAREGATTAQTEPKLGSAGRRRQPGSEPQQLKQRPTGQCRKEEAEFQVYSQGGNHHSSNGDQLGSTARRRESLRCTARE